MVNGENCNSRSDASTPGIAYGPTSYKKTILQVLSRAYQLFFPSDLPQIVYFPATLNLELNGIVGEITFEHSCVRVLICLISASVHTMR